MSFFIFSSDATWKDIIAAFRCSAVNNSSQERKLIQGKLEKLFGGSEQWLACLSIRTAFDAFLTVVNFPHGSEVIFTAINIPDMVSVVERHGLKVVPVDLDLDSLAPKPELVELAVTDKTVAILAAHLYGKWINLDKVFQVAHSHGLYVLEDCAESFQGLGRKGHKLSDLTFFSFGSIMIGLRWYPSNQLAKMSQMIRQTMRQPRQQKILPGFPPDSQE